MVTDKVHGGMEVAEVRLRHKAVQEQATEAFHCLCTQGPGQGEVVACSGGSESSSS